MAEENIFGKLFSGFTHNMCKIVTDFSVESYTVHEVCIKINIFMQQRCSFAALIFFEAII